MSTGEDEILQFELGLFFRNIEPFKFFWFSLILYIIFNSVCICMSSYCGDIVTICPKYWLPEIFLEELTMLFSKKSSCYTFDNLYHIFWGYHRNRLQKKMDMIEIYSNLMKYNFIRLFLYLVEAYFSNRLIKYFMLEYFSSVLYRAYQMIQE